MGILGGKFNDEDNEEDGGDGEALRLDLADRVCPECGADLPPWVDLCPTDGAAPVARDETMLDGPAVPAHLLAELDDPGPDPGAHPDTGTDPDVDPPPSNGVTPDGRT